MPKSYLAQMFIQGWFTHLKKAACGLYYKTITIVIMMIISDATIWSVTYDRNWRH